MKARNEFAFAAQNTTIGDTFNLFLPLPDESVDGYTYRPKHCGINFMYDEARKKMKVSLCFRRAMPGDGQIRQLFGLAPIPVPVDLLPDDLNGSSTDSSVSEEDATSQAAIILQQLDLLGNVS
jgi:hypothetical protein